MSTFLPGTSLALTVQPKTQPTFYNFTQPPTVNLAWVHLSFHHVTRQPPSLYLFCKHILRIYLSPSAKCQHTLKAQL